MKLKEHEGKAIFKKYGIPVPKGYVVSTVDEAVAGLGEQQSVVVKAQVLVGGRGKAGGVKLATKENLSEVASQILGMDLKGLTVNEVLIEEAIQIDKELYMSFTVNRSDRAVTFIFSEEGGVDIEQLAKDDPDKILKYHMHEFDAAAFKKELSAFTKRADEVLPFAEKLFTIFKELDCELVEINPLVISDGKLLAADSKVIIDDNALFRHEEYTADKKETLTSIEQKALEYSLQYIELDGDIAIIGNGAGLVMATLDAVSHFDGSCANFLDVGGGANTEKMEHALEVVLMKKPKAVFINIFGGITRCDQIAQGLVNYRDKTGIDVPLVVRMIGTNEEEGQKILREHNIPALDSMEECAQKVVELAKA